MPADETTTGARQESDVVDVDADAYAYVTDGEYSVVWAATREGDHHISTRTFLVRDGEAREDPNAGDREFGADPDETTLEWAEKYAENHPSAIAVARDWWDEWTDEDAQEADQ